MSKSTKNFWNGIFFREMGKGASLGAGTLGGIADEASDASYVSPYTAYIFKHKKFLSFP